MRHEEQRENINLHEIPKSVWCVGSEDIWENLARDRKEDGGGKDRGSGTDTTIKSNQMFLTGGHQQIKKNWVHFGLEGTEKLSGVLRRSSKELGQTWLSSCSAASRH